MLKFTVNCEMKERWIPYFLQMLKQMELQGAIGHSGQVAIFADGDGDFHPKFDFDSSLMSEVVKPITENDNCVIFDAG